jgi:hypothetical protein
MGMLRSGSDHWCNAAASAGYCSPERSKCGDEVLKGAERLAAIGMMRNPVAQTLRNRAAHVMLGLGAVRRALADTMTEASIGYPDSPLSGPRLQGSAGPKSGERIIPDVAHGGHRQVPYRYRAVGARRSMTVTSPSWESRNPHRKASSQPRGSTNI